MAQGTKGNRLPCSRHTEASRTHSQLRSPAPTGLPFPGLSTAQPSPPPAVSPLGLLHAVRCGSGLEATSTPRPPQPDASPGLSLAGLQQVVQRGVGIERPPLPHSHPTCRWCSAASICSSPYPSTDRTP